MLNNLALFEKTRFVTSATKECHVILMITFTKTIWSDTTDDTSMKLSIWILLRLLRGYFNASKPCLKLSVLCYMQLIQATLGSRVLNFSVKSLVCTRRSHKIMLKFSTRALFKWRIRTVSVCLECWKQHLKKTDTPLGEDSHWWTNTTLMKGLSPKRLTVLK